jgi:predicted amidohydrolase YtcJ
MRPSLVVHALAQATAFFLAFGCWGGSAAPGPAGGHGTVETVYYNGIIHTLDERSPLASAVAVRGDRILAVGSTEQLLSAFGSAARRVDLQGRAVMPGLVDAHCHFMGYAEERAWIDLVGASSLEQVLQSVSAKTASAAPGSWILGRGWDQNDWAGARYPDKAALDRIAPDNPVYLVRVCGHAAYVNSRTLLLAGISRDTKDPVGGKIIRDAAGEPTGVLLDEAKEMVARIVPPPGKAEKKRLAAEASQACLAVGLVGVHEMGISLETDSLYRELYADKGLALRVVAYWSGDDPNFDKMLERGPVRGLADDHYSIVGCKFYADGSLGARSAALLADYSDDPGNRGILVTDPDKLASQVRACQARGFQSAIHAIGDAAVREALDDYARILSESPAPDARHRIEHAQVVSPEDVPRFAALGVVPSMQFTHCTSDMDWAAKRLGPERVKGAYAWRSLIDAGSRIPGGSDFPVESINPFLGIFAAVTRENLLGKPVGGWFPAQRLTLLEAVRAFTVEAAWAVHEEAVAGSLSPGKRADFIVLSDDIFSVRPEVIPRIKVLETIIGGAVVYRADGF